MQIIVIKCPSDASGIRPVIRRSAWTVDGECGCVGPEGLLCGRVLGHVGHHEMDSEALGIPENDRIAWTYELNTTKITPKML
jgi:hypothetical protein